MNVKSTTNKMVGAGLAGVLLAGAGMTAALADTPAPPQGTYTMDEVTNLTPYVWTLYGYDPDNSAYQVAPPTKLAPGQTASWAPKASGGSDHTLYTFSDAAGGPVHLMYVVHDPFSSYSYDQGNGEWDESPSYHMAFDPDGNARHVDAVWNSGASITVDAKTDPGDASRILDSELPRVAADQVQWTATSNTPTWQEVDGQQLSSTVENYSSRPVSLDVSKETSVGESTSIGEELTASVSTKVFGAATKAAASVTSDQEWGSKDTVSIYKGTEIGTGCSGWEYQDRTFATLPGTLTFTTPENVTYTVLNANVTRGDMTQPGNANVPNGVDTSATEGPIHGMQCTPPTDGK